MKVVIRKRKFDPAVMFWVLVLSFSKGLMRQLATFKRSYQTISGTTISDAEEIRQEDGKDKQDCEINAAMRLIPRLVTSHPHMDIVIVADGLYSHVPFVQLLRHHGPSFILVAKPSDHIALFEDLKRG